MSTAAKYNVQTQEVRKRLLAAALELFTRKGYAATSVREIVEVAGVTKPVLYYHFKSKEGIYLDLFREPFRLFDDFLNSYPGVTGNCATKALTEICESVFELFVENLDTARLMYSIYYGPPQGAPFFDFDEYHIKLQRKVRELVEQGIGTGEFGAVDIGNAMWIIIGVLNVAMEEQLCREKPGIDRLGLERMLTMVLAGFAGRGRG